MSNPFQGYGESGDNEVSGKGWMDKAKGYWANDTIRMVTYAVVVLIVVWIIYRMFFKENFSPRLGFFNPKNAYVPSRFVGDDGDKLLNFESSMTGKGRRVK